MDTPPVALPAELRPLRHQVEVSSARDGGGEPPLRTLFGLCTPLDRACWCAMAVI